MALFLDLDGTLAPIASRPEDVRPDARRSSLLRALDERLDGRLAVVSGRTLEEVDHILERRVAAVAAVHGLVRRSAQGVVEQAAAHPALAEARQALRRFADQDTGLLVEDKRVSVTLHYRLAPACAAEAQALAAEIAQRTGLVLQRGDMVVELRTPGPNKGDSLRTFLEAAPFRGAQPVFLGDDVTDEDGFRAAAELGGFGVLVGAPRVTEARYRIPSVDAALAWLEAAR